MPELVGEAVREYVNGVALIHPEGLRFEKLRLLCPAPDGRFSAFNFFDGSPAFPDDPHRAVGSRVIDNLIRGVVKAKGDVKAVEKRAFSPGSPERVLDAAVEHRQDLSRASSFLNGVVELFGSKHAHEAARN